VTGCVWTGCGADATQEVALAGDVTECPTCHRALAQYKYLPLCAEHARITDPLRLLVGVERHYAESQELSEPALSPPARVVGTGRKK
jgi:hypothetical protein